MLCAAPFIHQFIYNDGSPGLCCAAERNTSADYTDWNGEDYQKIRKHMLEEKELPEICVDCKLNESVNRTSTRDVNYDSWVKLGKPELDIVTGTAIDAPMTYDLRMNNICNLSCRMCGPSSSSQIAKEAEKHPRLWQHSGPINFDRYNKFDPTEIIENAGAIFELKLLGGEPSLQPEAKALLQELVNIGNTHIKLFITTNGTNYNKSFWGLVEKFSDVRVNVSIDAWEKQHEYIRGPAADWKTIWSNTKKISNISNLMLQQTVTLLNIFDFWKLRQNSPFPVESFICYLPEKYAPQNMPLKWKQKAIEIAKENDAYEGDKNIFNLMMNDGETRLLKGLPEYTKLMDSVRNQHLIDYYPITWNMLEDIG